jgi:hypothetical protein
MNCNQNISDEMSLSVQLLVLMWWGMNTVAAPATLSLLMNDVQDSTR